LRINHFYNADCTKLLNNKRIFQDNSIDLIYADPPYNLSGNKLQWYGNKTGGDWNMVNEDWDKMSTDEYLYFTDKWITGCKRILRHNSSIYISCSYHNIGEIILSLKKNLFKINNIITWYKTNPMPNMTKRVYTHASEFIIWAVKGKNWVFNYQDLKLINPEKQKDGSLKQMRDVWKLPLVQGKERLKDENNSALHKTQKPEEMLKRIIIASSNIGDIVLDPFSGSGTTAAVARKLNRRWIGIENNEIYLNAARLRISQKIGQ
jgi:site-specific DNA-methyltransferase (adenine-specific)